MTIYFTKRAENNFRDIIEYLQEEWGGNVAGAFQKKLNHFLNVLERYPKIGSMEVPNKEIFGFQLSKQVRVF